MHSNLIFGWLQPFYKIKVNKKAIQKQTHKTNSGHLDSPVDNLTALAFELNIGNRLGNVCINFGCSMPNRFRVKSLYKKDGQRKGQTDKHRPTDRSPTVVMRPYSRTEHGP